MKTKKRKTQFRQEQIKSAALDVISRRGLKGMTIATLARATGMTESNIYRHFRDKRALMGIMIAEIGSSLRDILRSAAGSNAPPLQRLEGIFFHHIGFLKKHKGILRIVLADETYSAHRGISLGLQHIAEDYLREIEKILEQAVAQRTLPRKLDIPAAAIIFLGLIYATALRWMIFGNRLSPNLGDERIWRMYLKGISS